jgi:PAS domain S-box-containing protein
MPAAGKGIHLPDASRAQLGDLHRDRVFIALAAAGVLLLVIVSIVVVVQVAHQFSSARETRDAIRQTRLIGVQLQTVFSTLQDAETGERGYVITGQREFLDPFYDAQHSLEPKLKELLRLVAHDPLSQDYRQLAARAREQLAFLQRVVEQRDRDGVTAAASPAIQQLGKAQMDGIREVVERLHQSGDRSLNERLDMTTKRSADAESMALSWIAAAGLFGVISGVLLTQHMRRRRRTDRELTTIYGLLRATLDSIAQGIAVFDAQWQLLAWNSRFIELRGIDVQVVHRGVTLEELMSDAAPVKYKNEFAANAEMLLRRLRQHETFTDEIERGDGIVIETRGTPMPGGNYVLTYMDVTPLKRSELAHRDQATRLTAILDNAMDAIITINESGSIESFSRGAERLFGWEAREILRRDINLLMQVPHTIGHDAGIQGYLPGGQAPVLGTRRQLEAKHKEGHTLPVELSLSEMRLAGRRVFVGVLRDLTERLEVDRLKNEFISTVSHELRTPLTSISGSLGLLAAGVTGELPVKARRLVDIARQNSERLVRLINDILDLEKAEAGKLALRFEVQSLRGIVEQVIEANRPYAQSFGASIELDADSIDHDVNVDRDRVIQVLTNLVSNAAKVSPRDGVVRIRIDAVADSARVTISDQGPGLPDEFRSRVFQKFAQVDGSDSRNRSGTGLGLSIAKTLIERLGGRIGFDSVAGRGAQFHITLPVVTPHEPVQTAAITQDANPAVLICEDDPDMASVLTELLRADHIYSEIASSARAALIALRVRHFDVALMDLNLPDADGLDLVAQLRNDDATRHLPIIAITARMQSESDRNTVCALQIADWLQKPVDPRRLLAAVRGAARGGLRHMKILHVEDDESLGKIVEAVLESDAQVTSARSVARARQLLEDHSYDLIILDLALQDGSGLELLADQRQPLPPILLYSASEAGPDVAARVQATLVKSRDSVDQLLQTVRRLSQPPPRAAKEEQL